MNQFRSGFAQNIQDMLDYKEALGYSSSSYEYFLLKFDEFCCENYPKETFLLKEIVFDWAIAKKGESINTLNRRVAVIREFGRYLNSIGIPAYVFPAKMTGAQKQYTPHIFTDSELKSFFYGADHYEKSAWHPMNTYIVPVIFRLIYCCGLRPQEGRLIRTKDIDTNSGKLFIRESKGHKDRIVMLTHELIQLCQSYLQVRELHGVDSEYLFPDNAGHVHGHQWLEYQFQKCWKIAGVQSFTNPPPRVYDFRHTFATKRLCNWMDQKEDLYFWLPYLSVYMGHANFSATAYYIHLLPERLKGSPAIDWKAFADLLPEVPV